MEIGNETCKSFLDKNKEKAFLQINNYSQRVNIFFRVSVPGMIILESMGNQIFNFDKYRRFASEEKRCILVTELLFFFQSILTSVFVLLERYLQLTIFLN